MSKQSQDDYIELMPVGEIITNDPMQETVASDPLLNSTEQKTDQISEKTAIFQAEAPKSARFQIHFTIIKDEIPAIIVLNCSGDMIGSNCLILHNTFKMCSAKRLPFIIVDLTDVSSIEKEVWEYFSSKATKIQKSNGILLFSGIRSSVLSETTDFHKMNICHCETIETCCLVIRNLVPEHEKKGSYFPEQQKNLKKKDSNQPPTIAIFSGIDDSIIIDDAKTHEKEHINVDDSMSTSFSIPSDMQIDVDESMSTDYSITNEELPEIPVNIDESMSVDFSNSENQTTDKIISVAKPNNAIKMIEDEEFQKNHTGKGKLLFVDELLDSNAKPSSSLFFDPKEYTLSEKIHIIIAHYGPCSFRKIKNMLNSKDFGDDTISTINLYKTLKAMDLESTKKRIRYYRSC